MNQATTVIAFQRAKPAQFEALAQRVRGLIDAARADPGCLAYRVAVSESEPFTLVFYERWASRDALDAHFGSSSFQAFWGERLTFLERDVEVVIASDFV
jgi:quinol monooxygenase YgiN